MIDRAINVWIGEARGVVPVFHLSQYDTVWKLKFSVYNERERWTIPQGAQVVMNGRRDTGEVFTVNGAVSQNTAIIEVPPSMTATPGRVECELRFTDDEEVVSTANFVLTVERSPLAGRPGGM